MSQIEMVIEELNQLPEANVRQVVAFIHELRETPVAKTRKTFTETAGCMSPVEADEFQRVIDENCERTEGGIGPFCDALIAIPVEIQEIESL